MNKLVQLRAGKTQAEIVREMNIPGLDRPAYAHLELEHYYPTPTMAQSIAAFHGVPVETIWPGYAVYTPEPETSSCACAQYYSGNYYNCVVSYIPLGRENAITRKELETLTGFSDRENRNRIRAAKKAGYPIVSLQRGYYFCNDPAEIERYCRRNDHYAIDMLDTSRAMRRFSERVQVNGQIKMPPLR